ncbi:hypothetical protein PYW08_010610 [Mythimna loreyi]|uniref:Uncharacterized protein n=1 Tax=Mythimna loreyi TaxID=667449 RepID=A0ACC2Q430_9NEOP|nr:hypothetical protein PYW08_010610 [Mythimna loreyi]
MFSKSLSVLLLVYFLSDFSIAQRNETSLRKDYVRVNGLQGSYKVHATPKTWHEAKQVCADEDAILFYPRNRKEVNAAIYFWERDHSAPPSLWIFVGISDIRTEGVFETVDGKPLSAVFGDWSPHQPDNWGNEDCVQLSFMGVINDISCDAHFGFMCEGRNSSRENQASNLDNEDGTYKTST